MSPTERTLALYRKQGYVCGKVERWIERTKQRIDLFGTIDILCIQRSVVYTGDIEYVYAGGIIGVQASSGSNHAAHRTKALCEPLLGVWLQAGGRFQIVTWSQKGPAGKRKVWTERVEELTLKDFHDPIATAQRADAVLVRESIAAQKGMIRREKLAARRRAKAEV